eukprot:6086271-Pleurochrysis_carterae.AAC.2
MSPSFEFWQRPTTSTALTSAPQCLHFNFASILYTSYALNAVAIYNHSVNQSCCAGGVDDGALNATTTAAQRKRRRRRRSASSDSGW